MVITVIEGICLTVRREAFDAKEAAEAYLLYADASGPRRRRHRKSQ
jgi:hypothetical protein